MTDERYLRLLSEKFPNAQAVITELINLRAILSLPKGTEHFVSDLHGASMAFIHMFKNASGVVRRKVDEVYGDTMAEEEKRALCALIYYPDERIEIIKRFYAGEQVDSIISLNSQICELKTLNDWYRIRLHQVVDIARAVTIKYSRSKVEIRMSVVKPQTNLNKEVKIRIAGLFAEKTADSFEEGIDACLNALETQLERRKNG